MSVQQSGSITPGHVPIWVTPGVIGDGGAALAGSRVLASLRSANFNTTADQPITIPLRFTAFALTGIGVTNASVSLTTAVGGFYPAAAKGGTPIVMPSLAYSSLTTSAGLHNVALSSFGSGTPFSASNLGAIGGASRATLLQAIFPSGSPLGYSATVAARLERITVGQAIHSSLLTCR
jgi:hypothetical protein